MKTRSFFDQEFDVIHNEWTTWLGWKSCFKGTSYPVFIFLSSMAKLLPPHYLLKTQEWGWQKQYPTLNLINFFLIVINIADLILQYRINIAINHHQLQDALITGTYIYLCQAFQLLLQVIISFRMHWWLVYMYLPMSCVPTSTISHHQLQDALINGIYNFV